MKAVFETVHHRIEVAGVTPDGRLKERLAPLRHWPCALFLERL